MALCVSEKVGGSIQAFKNRATQPNLTHQPLSTSYTALAGHSPVLATQARVLPRQAKESPVPRRQARQSQIARPDHSASSLYSLHCEASNNSTRKGSNKMSMPSRITVSQSKVSSSFWFVQKVSRVRTEHHLCIMDDFGNLVPVSHYALRGFYGH